MCATRKRTRSSSDSMPTQLKSRAPAFRNDARAELAFGQIATGSRRLGRRISRMLSTRSQTQNSRYGTVNKSIDQTNLADTRPRPATRSHQPIQRSSARVERITQPEQSAKLATAIHAFAKPTLANAHAKSATSGVILPPCSEAAPKLTPTSPYAASSAPERVAMVERQGGSPSTRRSK